MSETQKFMEFMLTTPIDKQFTHFAVEEDFLNMSYNFSIVHNVINGVIENDSEDDPSNDTTQSSSPILKPIAAEQQNKKNNPLNEAKFSHTAKSSSRYVMGSNMKALKITGCLKSNWLNKMKTCKEVMKNKLIAKINFISNGKVNNYKLGSGKNPKLAYVQGQKGMNSPWKFAGNDADFFLKAQEHILKGKLKSTDPVVDQIIKNMLIKNGPTFVKSNCGETPVVIGNANDSMRSGKSILKRLMKLENC